MVASRMPSWIRSLFAPRRKAARGDVRPWARLSLEGMEERVNPVSLPFNPQQLIESTKQLVPA